MNVNIYKSSEECNSRLAEYLIENYLSKNKNIAISGGSTPIGLFNEILNQIDKKFKIKSNFFGLTRDVLILHRLIVTSGQLTNIFSVK